MGRALYHGYSSQFTLAASSTTLPAFVIANTDNLHAMQLEKYRIGMAGTGSASVTFQVFATSTAATAAGTSTAATVTQASGRIMAIGGISVCNQNYTGARTTETYIVVDEVTMVNNQTIIYDYQQSGDNPDCPLGVATFGAGFGIFLSSGTPVATTIDMWVSRI